MKSKILILGKLPPPHIGPATATRIILGSDLNNRFRLIHLDTSDHRDIRTLGRFDLRNICIGFRLYLAFAWHILRYLPDAAYIPSQQTTVGYLRDVPYVLLAKIFGAKVVFHLRGGNFRNWYDASGAFMRWLARAVQKRIDAQIVLGEKLRGMFDGLTAEGRIHVVPNGGDFPKPTAPRSDGTVRVLFLSNFLRSKGVLDVLAAVPRVAASGLRVEFIFAGSWRDAGTKREFLSFLASHRDLPVRVEGVVEGDRKLGLLGESDMFVFPTYYPNEGHPWVIIEAMAAGLPVITTDHAAIGESVIHGRNGFLVSKRNPDEIADKVLRLAGDRSLRESMGRESRAIYEAGLTAGAMAASLARVFDSVLERS